MSGTSAPESLPLPVTLPSVGHTILLVSGVERWENCGGALPQTCTLPLRIWGASSRDRPKDGVGNRAKESSQDFAPKPATWSLISHSEYLLQQNKCWCDFRLAHVYLSTIKDFVQSWPILSQPCARLCATWSKLNTQNPKFTKSLTLILTRCLRQNPELEV